MRFTATHGRPAMDTAAQMSLFLHPWGAARHICDGIPAADAVR